MPGTAVALMVTGKILNTHSKVKCWETDIPQPQVLWLLYRDLGISSLILGADFAI